VAGRSRVPVKARLADRRPGNRGITCEAGACRLSAGFAWQLGHGISSVAGASSTEAAATGHDRPEEPQGLRGCSGVATVDAAAPVRAPARRCAAVDDDGQVAGLAVRAEPPCRTARPDGTTFSFHRLTDHRGDRSGTRGPCRTVRCSTSSRSRASTRRRRPGSAFPGAEVATNGVRAATAAPALGLHDLVTSATSRAWTWISTRWFFASARSLPKEVAARGCSFRSRGGSQGADGDDVGVRRGRR
jgi:hypothetical protein